MDTSCKPGTNRSSGSAVRCRRCGWAISLLLHVVLAAGLAAASFQPWWAADWAVRHERAIHVEIADGQLAEETPPHVEPEVRIVSDPAEVTAEMVRERLEEVVAQTEAMPEADKLARLDALSERLTQVSDEPSLGRLSGVMRSMLGTKPRAAQPAAERPPGDFDFDTAQFHDMQRHPKEPAGYRYVTVLLDAEGRTLEVDVSEQEGKPIYETLQRIKANPLLEQIYRQIVMPLLDQLMAGVKRDRAP